MPALGTFGAMSARAFGWGTGKGSAAFVVEHHYTATNSGNTVSFAGASAGDFALIVTVQAPTGTPSGWTPIGSISWGAKQNSVYTKTLTSGDISTGSIMLTPAVSGGQVFIEIYRGATTAIIVSSAAGSGTSLTVPGFNRSAHSRGVVTYCSTGVSGAGSVTSPSGAVQRLNYGSGSFASASADFLPASTYPEGSDVIWNGVTSGVNNSVAQIIELA